MIWDRQFKCFFSSFFWFLKFLYQFIHFSHVNFCIFFYLFALFESMKMNYNKNNTFFSCIMYFCVSICKFSLSRFFNKRHIFHCILQQNTFFSVTLPFSSNIFFFAYNSSFQTDLNHCLLLKLAKEKSNTIIFHYYTLI